jgi:YfiR/HmsC-like
MRRLKLQLALAATFLILGFEARAQNFDAAGSSEYLVKAGFIYNFAKLVEWPAATFTNPGQAIVVGVLGSDSFAATLEHVVDGKKVDVRPFTVKRLKSAKDSKECGCQMLFIASAESAHAEEIIQLLKGTSVLTIAETPGFSKQGGIINFVLEDSKVRFEVNVDAAKHAGLNISSRLLSLAKIVQTNMTAR